VVVVQVRDAATGSPGLIQVEVSGQSLRSDGFEFSVPGQAAQTLKNQPTAPEAVLDNEHPGGPHQGQDHSFQLGQHPD
jgi:hypothetical protein